SFARNQGVGTRSGADGHANRRVSPGAMGGAYKCRASESPADQPCSQPYYRVDSGVDRFRLLAATLTTQCSPAFFRIPPSPPLRDGVFRRYGASDVVFLPLM